MLDKIIRFALQNRLLMLAFAAALLVAGAYTARQLPVDVLPDLDRPRVTVFLEAAGMAPEEVEALVTLPVETALNGATGVSAVRSNSAIGLGMVFVEFDYGTDIFTARQIVAEKLQTVGEQLPAGITPVLGPISSVMGQIMLVGLSIENEELKIKNDSLSPPKSSGSPSPMERGPAPEGSREVTTAAGLRTLANYTVRQRLLSIPGVAQVIPIGGENLQYQVLLDMPRLNAVGLTITQVEDALRRSNLNTTGNFFDRNGSEVLIRNLGRLRSVEDIENIIVGYREASPVTVKQVATVAFGARFKRGDGSVNGRPAVILSIEKQPGAATVGLTEAVEKALAELKPALPPDVQVNTRLFKQSDFIESSITNVEEALRDGAILVVIVLFAFLLNVRTTFISLVAIPLSLLVTALVFRFAGISINTMTLGGLAIAIGELVDDAIVDVENVFRRLRENQQLARPRPALQVIYAASSEVRNSIVYATIIVVLVFLPLFALEGMEGRIFAPLGIAYITSIVASLFVSLTITPVLCYYLLPGMKQIRQAGQDGGLVRWLKRQDTRLLHWGLARPRLVLGTAAALFGLAVALVPFFGTEFLPPFNEGSLTVNFSAPAGTSLAESNKLGTLGEQQMLKLPEVAYTARRTGRAELDEHAESVNNSEIEVAFKTEDELEKQGLKMRSRDEILTDLRQKLSLITGVNVNIGQPISHRLDHLLSGVRAQVAIKVFGNDLLALRRYAGEIRAAAAGVPGVVDLQVEKQVQIPQLLVRPRDAALQAYGLDRGRVVATLQTLFQGEVVSQMLDGQQRFDLLVKLPENQRNDIATIAQTRIETPAGALIPVSQVADVRYEPGPNTINHENSQRRIILSLNVAGRDLGSTVREIQAKVGQQVKLPAGYYLTYGGQFESQQAASRKILWLSLFSLTGIFLVLFSHFRSGWLVAQIMLNIPLALIGSVVAVLLTGGTFSIASLVGFITLTGIASRNGIMMISHYIHLVEHEGEKFGPAMIIRGSLERLVPVLMTALVAALALVPLTLAKDAPGKEILYPVATVILGGLLSSTFLDIIVTPVAFWLLGEKALAQYRRGHHEVSLDEHPAEPAGP
ncbi:heavy-metal exporter, HME family [Hymenobacter daecheongensis DSM 21074]|uniref:Heavy-metal exporter, HME family n=1 Tax=Hymenobacter daecheongensis DSM 21074 TaxID=1121955 RepID=A0A1M6G3L7_9BACT|nr:efflux RND transporter permease subunit [Hymenobacter daecheongensis]SHJ04561.1 heavy-metal exporter, HME family [Hymenobacter daecheongensis DSM 21074]